MATPELLILAPADDHRVHREYVQVCLDEGLEFPFSDRYELPRELPAELDGCRCILLDPRRRAEFAEGPAAAQLLAFRQAGGYVQELDLEIQCGGALGDLTVRHAVQRIIATAGLTMHHPRQVARLQAWDEKELVRHWRAALPDELGQYERMGNYFCDPVGYTSFRGAAAAAEYFGDPAAAQPMWDYIACHGLKMSDLHHACGSRFVLAHYERTGDPRFLEAVLQVWRTPDQWALDGVLLNNDLTVPPGSDWQQPPPAVVADAWTWPEVASGLADTLPELSRVTGNPAWLERAVTHVLGAHRWLYDPELRLWRHIGRPTGPDPRAVPWGRGNAWFLYALRGLLEGLPADHPRRPEAIAALAAGFEGIHARQQPDGLWLNVLDATPDASRSCASATIRYLEIYGQAYLAGWLRDPRIPPMIERAWLGLKTKIWRHGLIAVCVGTAYGLSRQVYLARPHHTYRPSRSSLLLAWITRQRLAAMG